MKNILLTGASGGIGSVIAKTLSKDCNVFITGRNEQVLKELAANMPGNVKFFACDLTNDNATTELFNIAKREFGGIDVLINNAGEYVYAPIGNVKQEDITRLLKLNTQIPYELINLCTENMKRNKFGRIINIGSISGIVGEANASLYSMTKSAFVGLSKALALELAQYNITVNTINPGFVKTKLVENTFDKDFTEEELLDMIPQNRFIEPIEIANFIKYLISDEAKGITGQSINLCAGMSIG